MNATNVSLSGQGAKLEANGANAIFNGGQGGYIKIKARSEYHFDRSDFAIRPLIEARGGDG